MPKKIEENTLVGDVLHSWTMQEYDQPERGLRWYILMITVGVILVLYGIFAGNFLFSLIIILFAIILFLQSHQAPPQVLFQITELGVVLGDRFYSYLEFDDFYIVYQPPEIKTLFLNTKSTFLPLLRIPLLDKNPVEIRHILREYLPEDIEKEDEPMADKFVRNWRFH